MSRSGAGVEGSCPPRRAPSFAYKALSRFPLHWSVFSLTPSLCALLRYSFVIYSFNLISMASTYCQSITHSSTEASVVTFSKLLPPLRCVDVRLHRSLRSVCAADEWPSVSDILSRQPVTPVRSHGRPPGGWTNLEFRRRRSALRQTDPGLFKAGKAGD